MSIEFTAVLWYWRGPAPWYFLIVPEQPSLELHAIAGVVTYGWGMIPVRLCIGRTVWSSSLWPKDGRYLVPVKARVRAAERLAEGDMVTVRLEVH